MSLFPLASWERIENRLADARLIEWQHYLGACKRPFGRQSFGFYLLSELRGVAVSACTVGQTCAGRERNTVVELARLCVHPGHRDLTRIVLRLWRLTAAEEWMREYWPVKALVSYAQTNRHNGDVYRFDGWQRWGETRASKVGQGSHHSTPGTIIEKKSVWVYPVAGEVPR